MSGCDFDSLPSPREVRHYAGTKRYTVIIGNNVTECGSFREAEFKAGVLGFRIIRRHPVRFDDFLQYAVIPSGFTPETWASECVGRMLASGYIEHGTGKKEKTE